MWKISSTFYISFNISNTIESVLLGYPNTEKKVENTTRMKQNILDEIRGVWKKLGLILILILIKIDFPILYWFNHIAKKCLLFDLLQSK